MSLRLSWFVLVLAGSGCVAHTTLRPPPPPEAPLEERRVAYEALAPVGMNLAPVPGQATHDFLLLGNGERIEDPTDLLLAVEPESPTARYSRAYDEAWRKSQIAMVIFPAIELFGSGLLVYGATQISPSGSSSSGSDTLMIVGLSTLLVGMVGMLAPGLLWTLDAARERQSAFLMYPKDLRHRLRLEEPSLAAAPAPAPALSPP